MAIINSLSKVTNGSQLNEGWFNSTYLGHRWAMLNTIRQLEDRSITMSAGQQDVFAEAYVNADGRLNTVSTGDTTALFNTNKYTLQSSTEPFIIIEATSVTTANFAINDCLCKQIDSGTWILYCTSGTNAVKRAKIYKTLFYGSNGQAKSGSITGITALKTNISKDVGKRAYYYFLNSGTIDGEAVWGQTVGTFSNTSTNTSCSMWTRCRSQHASAGADGEARAYFPSNSLINSATNGNTNDEIGTDTESDEENNPSGFKLRADDGNNVRGYVDCIVLSNGEITVTNTQSHSASVFTTIDFYTDNSIPVLTEYSGDFPAVIIHDIPTGTFSATISSAIGVAKIGTSGWEAGADIEYKLTNATEDTGWLDCGNSPLPQTFTAFTSEPTKLIVKLIPKSVSPSAGLPAINGFAVYSE